VEQGNDGIIIIQDGLLRFANSKMVEITGFSLEETLGKPFANFVSLGDRRLVADRYRRRIAGEAVPSKYEIKILSESGKRIPVEVSGSSIEYEGRPADMAIIRDISERKRAERLIRESGERYRSLVNNVRLGILRSTPGPPGRILEVNPAFEEITGYFRDELLAMDMEELYIHPEERQALMEELTLAKGVVTRELHWRKKDGSEIVVLDTVITVRSKAGKVLHFDSIFEDITKRKQAERLLRESEERYRALVNLRGKFGAAIIMLQDTDQGEGVHTFVSDQWCHMTGYSREELLGMPFFDVVHPQDRVESMERHRRKMRGEAVPGLYELSLITKDGIEVPIELTSAYTVYQGKAANVAYIRDITERKQMEQHLIITDRLASVGELASGIAHELNNPLTSVIGFSQLVLDKEIPDDIKEDVRIISSEAQRAAGVVKNLLTFARKHAQVKELANINDIINKVLELRSYEQRVNNIRVETQFAADLPSVMADYFQLQQVFLNMVINAEHFMVEAHNKGTLTITTERVDRVVKAAFADDGPGIPEEDLGHVFDPFFTTKEVGKGTGLGLSICHGIITEHGGQIYAASELGKGATFIVELPIP
jgi:two-component system NtrC family sensor kinase